MIWVAQTTGGGIHFIIIPCSDFRKEKNTAEYVAPQADLLKLQNRIHLPAEMGMGATMPLAQQVMLQTVLRNLNFATGVRDFWQTQFQWTKDDHTFFCQVFLRKFASAMALVLAATTCGRSWFSLLLQLYRQLHFPTEGISFQGYWICWIQNEILLCFFKIFRDAKGSSLSNASTRRIFNRSLPSHEIS